ncbi:CvpA family protein [Mucilaginibacter psychrotolerans]|uniref:SCP domain-containing protein n=1 Tax=Mucilaginibacter psychrotolerans TaxID=1524096 RepID=A0A4Y8SCB3_9SPHI|nr:CvpA family protein [Mucilaginibacter psychrotolerans]TFF36301.1 hypothetical protein E2R66_15810 [Mucilaginibacter psychrotolerans]
MNYIDLLLILILIICIRTGIKQGFILSALSLVAWVGSLIIGFLIYHPVAGFLHMMMPSAGFWVAPLSFIAGIFIGKFVLDMIMDRTLDRIPSHRHISRTNRLLGAIPGFANGFIWAVLISGILLLVPFTNGLSKETRESGVAKKLIARVSWMDDSLSPVFSDILNHTEPTKDTKIGGEEVIKLPFKVTDATERPDLEAEMLILINKERKEYGLHPLKADAELAVVARKHSADMFARSYFSHYTPEGADPYARMKKGNITFLTAGENIALAQTLPLAHTGLMNSPGHRANILHPAYGRVGIGILDGGLYGLMITQNFRN